MWSKSYGLTPHLQARPTFNHFNTSLNPNTINRTNANTTNHSCLIS